MDMGDRRRRVLRVLDAVLHRARHVDMAKIKDDCWSDLDVLELSGR